MQPAHNQTWSLSLQLIRREEKSMSQPQHGDTGETSSLQMRSHHLGERHVLQEVSAQEVTHGNAAETEDRCLYRLFG